MKKKGVIVLATIVIILEVLITFCNTSFYKIHMAKSLFGNNICPENRHMLEVGGDAVSPYSCKICRRVFQHGNTNTPVLCEECAEITSRCNMCGDLIEEN